MSRVKQMMEEKYALYDVAADILERVGAIKTCEAHGDRYLVDESKLVGAYKLANAWISRGLVDSDRRELTDAIKEIMEMIPEECSYCANIMYDED